MEGRRESKRGREDRRRFSPGETGSEEGRERRRSPLRQTLKATKIQLLGVWKSPPLWDRQAADSKHTQKTKTLSAQRGGEWREKDEDMMLLKQHKVIMMVQTYNGEIGVSVIAKAPPGKLILHEHVPLVKRAGTPLGHVSRQTSCVHCKRRRARHSRDIMAEPAKKPKRKRESGRVRNQTRGEYVDFTIWQELKAK